MLICFRSYCPGTSILNLTRYQPPCLTSVPTWPERRDIDFPLRRCSAVAGRMVSASWQQVNGTEPCNPRRNGSTTEVGASTDMTGELGLARVPAENAANERTAPARVGSSARSKVEMWRTPILNNTRRRTLLTHRF